MPAGSIQSSVFDVESESRTPGACRVIDIFSVNFHLLLHTAKDQGGSNRYPDAANRCDDRRGELEVRSHARKRIRGLLELVVLSSRVQMRMRAAHHRDLSFSSDDRAHERTFEVPENIAETVEEGFVGKLSDARVAGQARSPQVTRQIDVPAEGRTAREWARARLLRRQVSRRRPKSQRRIRPRRKSLRAITLICAPELGQFPFKFDRSPSSSGTGFVRNP